MFSVIPPDLGQQQSEACQSKKRKGVVEAAENNGGGGEVEMSYGSNLGTFASTHFFI